MTPSNIAQSILIFLLMWILHQEMSLIETTLSKSAPEQSKNQLPDQPGNRLSDLPQPKKSNNLRKSPNDVGSLLKAVGKESHQ